MEGISIKGKTGFIFSTVGKVKNLRDVNFSYQGKIFYGKLPSLAVAKVENLIPILFVPHSLPEEEINILKKIVENQNIIFSPSLGSYNQQFYEIRFQALTFFYFFHFLQKYFSSKAGKFFADISIGLNQLTFAMLEAFRYLRVFSELSNLGRSKSEKPMFYITYSEPVMGRDEENSIYNIYREDFKNKVFISLPVTWKDENRLRGTIKSLPIKESTKKEFLFFVEKALYIATSIINNIPLAVYLLGYDPSKEIEKFLVKVLKELEPIMGNSNNPPDYVNEKGKIKYSFVKGGVEYRLLCNSILLLGLYLGIARILEKFNIPTVAVRGVKIDELDQKFKEIYRILFGENSKNEIILYKDLRDWEKKIKNFSKTHSLNRDWYDGRKLDNKHGHKTPNKRNFIAHSGLLNPLVEFNPKERKIKYKQEFREDIKKLLKEI